MSKVLELPEMVEGCGTCRGWGAYLERYMEGRFMSECSTCKGMQFVYKEARKPVGESVCAQIANANQLVVVPTYTGKRMTPLLAYVEDATWSNGLDIPHKPSWELPRHWLLEE